VRAIGARFAGNPAILARIALAGKARNAIVGVVATGLATQTAFNAEVALVCRIAAVVVVLASAATDDETTRELIAPRQKADFTGRTRGVLVAQRVHIRASGAKGAGVAPRAASVRAAVWVATVGAPVEDAPVVYRAVARVNAAVQIDTGVASHIRRERRGSGFTTAGHSCSSQQNVSKETHRERRQPRNQQRVAGPLYAANGSASASSSHPGHIAGA
jgi:hypothetical protein